MTEDEKTDETPDTPPAAPATSAADTIAEAEAAAPEATTPGDGESTAPADDAAAAETPAEAEAPSAAAEPQRQSEPKKKGKRLPRSQRPQKTRPTRTPSTERKPIVRLPKEEADRGRRQERRGVVVSDAMDKTIVVKVEAIRSHPRYKKVIRRSVKFHAHDEQNSAHVGDIVRIVETRPLSKTKNWRLAEIVEVAK
jgi:small subunit ribosomal protein S17